MTRLVRWLAWPLVRWLAWPLRYAVDEVRYAIAAARWEGWGRKGDPRNDRPILTREQWSRQARRR